VARGKTKKKQAKRLSFTFGTSKKKQSARAKAALHPGRALKAAGVVSVLVGVVVGLIFLNRYLRRDLGLGAHIGQIEFAGDKPVWLTEQLYKRVYAAATAGAKDLRLDETTAARVQKNIESRLGWLADVRVQVTDEKIRIFGRWRRPVALVQWGLEKFYVDADLVVLDYVPVPALPIVTLTGLTVGSKTPVAGEVWSADDLNAALAVLTRLQRMDQAVTPDKPLLAEIDSIDVSNFRGRRSKSQPHIILYTKEHTRIIWGAEIGAWQRYLEATDEEKLAKLYAYYDQYGTLAGVKYINLRDPQQIIHLPVDKY